MPEIEIKDNPKLKSFLRKVTELSFTSVIWGIWIYLFLPILNITLWVLGVRYFNIEVIEKVGYLELLGLLNKLGWTVLVLFVALRSWGYYNYWRFGRRNRRKTISPTVVEELAGYFQIPLEQVEQLISKKEVIWPVQGDLNQDVGDWLANSKGDNPKKRV